MPELHGYDTYWERSDGREILLSVNYHYDKECGEIEILNIRTSAGQDPTMVIPDWDRQYAVQVIIARLQESIKEAENE